MIFKFSDPSFTEDMLLSSRREAGRISEPVLKGERVGLYESFKDFVDKGVFDIVGKSLPLEDGKISPGGWKQVYQAMKVYRNKKFETFRYVLYDPGKREIREQVAVSSGIPCFSRVDKDDREIFTNVLCRMREEGLRLLICHNHPSSHTEPSECDMKLTKAVSEAVRSNCGEGSFMGHIILDHDSFSCFDFRKGEWMKISSGERGEDPLWMDDGKGILGMDAYGVSDVVEAGFRINDKIEWNKAYVPVLMVDHDHKVTGVSFYYKDFFRQEIPKVKDELLGRSLSVGAVQVFPVLPESFGRGYRDRPSSLLPAMEGLMRHNVVVDCLYYSDGRPKVLSSGFMGKDVPVGRSYYDDFGKMADEDGRISVVSTFDLKGVEAYGNTVRLVGERVSERERRLLEREGEVSGRERVLERKKESYGILESSFFRWAKGSEHKGEMVLVNMLRGLSENERLSVFSSFRKESALERGREGKRKLSEASVNLNVNDRKRPRRR